MSSTVTSVIGIDIKAYCSIYQEKYPNINIIYIAEDGFKGNWTLGVKSILKLLATSFPKDMDKTMQPTFNIVGSCADDFNYLSDCVEVKRMLKESFQAKPICIMTSDTSIEKLEAMGSAHVNLVLRQEALWYPLCIWATIWA
jgi:nitrogenase molybdenum-iron protein alpha/beta subunit